MLKKKLFLLSTIVILIAGALLFYVYKRQTPEIDKLILTLENIKKTIGIDLNLAPSRVKWNNGNEELTLSGKGGLYLDSLNSSKITEVFSNIDGYLLNSGFSNDPYNSDINDKISSLKKYKKDEIVCNLEKINNPNNTSSVNIACADVNKITYSFSSEKGTSCNENSECGVITDGCKRARVCRNLKFEFYNDCESPSQKIQDVDFSVAKCQCVSNQCVPKKSTPNESGQPNFEIK